MKKRILSLIMSLCLMLSLLPTTVFAAEGDGNGLELSKTAVANADGSYTISMEAYTTGKVTTTTTVNPTDIVLVYDGGPKVTGTKIPGTNTTYADELTKQIKAFVANLFEVSGDSGAYRVNTIAGQSGGSCSLAGWATSADNVAVRFETAQCNHHKVYEEIAGITDWSEGSDKVIIMFSAGEPVQGGVSYSKAGAIDLAKSLKETTGAKIYTVAIGEADITAMSKDPVKYLNYMSSNYPNASSMTNGGSRGEGDFCFAGESAADLQKAFEALTEDIGTPSISLDSTTVVKDIVPTYFEMPANTTAINLYTADYDGSKFGEPAAASGVTASIDGNTVSVTGFDFNKNFVSDKVKPDGTYGKKLIIEFTVTPTNEQVDAAEVPTNQAVVSAVYSGETQVESFEVPMAKAVPYTVKYLEKGTNAVLAEEKTAQYYLPGATVTETAKTIENYTAENAEQSLTISADGSNVITFYYTENPVTDELVVTANSNEKKYDGKALTDDGYTFTEGVLRGDDQLVVTVSGSQTDAGSSANTVTEVKVMRGDKDVTALYTGIKTADGTLTVNKRNVTLTSGTDSKTYDGTPLTNDTVEVTGDGFITGEGATYNVTGSRTDVGTSDNTFTYKLNDGTKDGNYNITPAYGTLTVSQITDTIKVTANSDTKMYDGDALTAGYTVTGDDKLADGDKLEVVVSGSQTDAGESANTVTSVKVVNAAGEDVTGNYANIVTENGTLTVTKRPVTLTSATADKTYDGTPLTAESVTVGGEGFAKGEGADYSNFASITNAGSTDNTFSYALKEGTKDTNYTITVVEGKLTVTKITDKLTVTADSADKMYDGEALTKDSYTSAGKLAKGDKLEVVVSGSRTDAGESANTVTSVKVVNAAGEDVTANYENIVKVPGTLTVTQRTVVMTSGTQTWTYDGASHSNTTVNVTGDGFIDGEGAEYSNFASITDVGSVKNTFEYKLNDNTKAGNYAISKVPGTLTVDKMGGVVVTVKEHSGVETYDGTEKTVTGYDVVSIKIGNEDTTLYTKEDFKFNGDATVTGTDAGTYDMEIAASDFENTNTNFKDVTFVVEDGQLVINPLTGVVVNITGNNKEFTYDGTEHTVTGYQAATENKLYDVTKDFTFSGSASASRTVQGTTDMGLAAEQFTNTNPNFENVTFNVTDGWVKINPIATKIVITADSDHKMYDGKALTDDGYTFTEDVLAEGDTLTAVVEGTITDVGTEKNVVTSYKVTNAKDEDVTNCYTFGESVDGTLEVTQRAVTLTSDTASKTYDGTALTAENVTVGGKGFVEGEGATYSDFASITDVGSIGNTFEYALNDNTKAGNYDITVIPGTLTVSKKGGVVVTITEHSGVETYDGTEKTVEGYDVSISDKLYTVDDFTFDGNDTVKGTTVGTYNMELKPEDFTNTNDNFKDVTFNIVDGTLTINPIATKIVITADSDNKVYDGEALTNAGYTYTENVLAEGDTLTAVVEGTITDVGTAANVVTSYKVTNAKDEDVTNCYTFGDSVDGTLEVTQRAVTLTSDTASKTYDGTALTAENVTVGGKGFVEGEGATYSDFASITNVGSIPNTFEYALNDNTKAGNYDITVIPGTLTVSKKGGVVVTITEHSGKYTYDGTEKTVEGYDVSISSELYTVDDFTFDGNDVVKGTDAGTYNMELKSADFTNINDNFETVTFNIVDGTLTINPIAAQITVTADSDEKVYDGKALTNAGYTYTENVLAEGDELTAVVEGTITDVGTEANVVTSYKVTNADGKDVTANYSNITTAEGTLEVTKRAVTLTSATDSKTYDGKALTNDTVVVSDKGFAEGEGATYDVTGSQTYVGTSSNTFTYELAENTNADNYDITVVEGTLTIDPVTAEIVVTANSNSKVYDGEALTDSGFTYTDGILAEGDELTAVVEGTVTNVGTEKNVVTSYVITNAAGEDVTENYSNITTVEGVLEITPATVVVTADDQTKATGDADPELTATVTGLVKGEGEELIVYTVSREAGEKAGKYVITPAGEELQGNYQVVYVPGTLTILQRALTVTKTVDKTSAEVGDKLTYTITVTNPGEVVMKNVVVTDEMLDTVIKIGDLDVGAVWTKDFTYKVTEDDAGKTLVNTVVVTSEDGTTVEDSSDGTTVAIPAPATGDSFNMGIYMMLAMLAMGAMAVMVVVPMKKQGKRQG